MVLRLDFRRRESRALLDLDHPVVKILEIILSQQRPNLEETDAVAEYQGLRVGLLRRGARGTALIQPTASTSRANRATVVFIETFPFVSCVVLEAESVTRIQYSLLGSLSTTEQFPHLLDSIVLSIINHLPITCDIIMLRTLTQYDRIFCFINDGILFCFVLYLVFFIILFITLRHIGKIGGQQFKPRIIANHNGS